MNYQKLLKYELTNTDLQKLVGKIPVIKFPNLSKYKSIDELLNNKYNAVIIFYETQAQNVGHWSTVFKNKYGIEYFDPYGLSPIEDLNHISEVIRVKLKEVNNNLGNLLSNTNENVIYNTHDYQKWAGDVSTCGRHTAVRLMNKNLSEKQYFNYLSNYMKENNLPSFDDCVVKITYQILKH